MKNHPSNLHTTLFNDIRNPPEVIELFLGPSNCTTLPPPKKTAWGCFRLRGVPFGAGGVTSEVLLPGGDRGDQLGEAFRLDAGGEPRGTWTAPRTPDRGGSFSTGQPCIPKNPSLAVLLHSSAFPFVYHRPIFRLPEGASFAREVLLLQPGHRGNGLGAPRGASNRQRAQSFVDSLQASPSSALFALFWGRVPVLK